MRHHSPAQVVRLVLIGIGCFVALSIAQAPRLASRLDAAAGHELGWPGLVLAFVLNVVGMVVSFFLLMCAVASVLLAGDGLRTRLRRRKPPQL